MKTLGRILMILAAFAIVMGFTYVVENALSVSSSSTSANPPAFERDGGNFSPLDGERPEFGEADSGGLGWMSGLVKNFGIVAVIVALIVVPKTLVRSKAVPVRVK